MSCRECPQTIAVWHDKSSKCLKAASATEFLITPTKVCLTDFCFCWIDNWASSDGTWNIYQYRNQKAKNHINYAQRNWHGNLMICFNKFTWCFSFFRLSCSITWFFFCVGWTGMIPISNKSQSVCRSEPCETLWQRADKLMCLATVFGRITLLNDTLELESWAVFARCCSAVFRNEILLNFHGFFFR